VTDRAKKIQAGKRERALAALTNPRRVQPGTLVLITQDEAMTIAKWLIELTGGDILFTQDEAMTLSSMIKTRIKETEEHRNE